MLRSIISHLFNIEFVILKTLSKEVSIFFQAVSILSFLAFEKGLDIIVLNLDKKVYFNDSVVLAFIFSLICITILAFYSYSKKITCLGDLFINTYIPCKIWTMVAFFLYSLITIPINFYLTQNLLADLEYYFKAGGYLITSFLPFVFLIFYLNKVLKRTTKQSA